MTPQLRQRRIGRAARSPCQEFGFPEPKGKAKAAEQSGGITLKERTALYGCHTVSTEGKYIHTSYSIMIHHVV